jgi:hypothetical protein
MREWQNHFSRAVLASRALPDLTSFFPTFFVHLCRHANESNARTSAYEAIGTFVTQSAADTLPVVSQVTLECLSRMEQLMTVQVCLLPYSAPLLSQCVRDLRSYS